MNSIDNYMSTKFDAEYSIPIELLLEFDDFHLAPVTNGKFVNYLTLYGLKEGVKSMSIREMIINEMDPFEDLSDAYDSINEEENE